VKVILRDDVANVGQKGDVVEVAPGFARNYLVPRGMAMAATKGAMAQSEGMRRAREQREARERAAATEIAGRLTAAPIRVVAKAGKEGRLFGTVTLADIATAAEAQTGVPVDRRRLHSAEPIRTAGVHEVTLKLHGDVEALLSVEVVTPSE